MADRYIGYAEAVREALVECMGRDRRVLLIGEGVPDPKGIFGTTKGLRELFGQDRVHDMPLSENGMTGICIGAALSGLRPIMVHQRIDFALLAMDQLVNNAAKWRYMFNTQGGVPLVVRVIIGRGWGQGPQHSQSLQALFGHVPGLKVVMPATAADAKGMMIAAVEENDPVIYIEHRWLHGTVGSVPEGYYRSELSGARVVRSGSDLTVAAFSLSLLDALQAANWLSDRGIECEVIDMRSVSPLDTETVARSVAKTGHLIVADTGHAKGGIASELIAAVVRDAFSALRKAPVVVALPDFPTPTTFHLADHFYPDAVTIVGHAARLLGREFDEEAAADLRRPSPRDVPDRRFSGPF